MSISTIRRLLVSTLALVATGAGGTAAAGEAHGVPLPRPAAFSAAHYVALGDSYTAGPLILWPSLNQLGCVRSTHDYPSLLADELRAGSLTDVSCSGASTTNLTQPQPLNLAGIPVGSNPPQFDALSAGTDLVTLGIGGNDESVFGNITSVCPALRSSDPTGAPCKAHFTVNGVDTMLADLVLTGQHLATALAGIHQRAPHARVLVIGYPRIVPPTGTCPDVIPFADGDYRWSDSVERALNSQLAGAAAAGGATYVDTYTPSLGHDACAGSAAWINGQHTNYLAAAAYHPFRAYMTAAAGLAFTALTGQPAPARTTTRTTRAASLGQTLMLGNLVRHAKLG